MKHPWEEVLEASRRGKGREVFAQDFIGRDPAPWVFFRMFLAARLESPFPSANFHREIFKALVSHNRLLLAAPRAHAKSTLCSFAYPLWAAVTGKKREIIIVSQTASLAEEWLFKIARELEENEALIECFGPQKRRGRGAWSSEKLTLRNGSTIFAKGREFQIRGFRPSLVVLDDIEDDRSVRSETQRRSIEQWFRASLINVLDEGGGNQLVWIGNFIGPGCLLKREIDRVEKKGLDHWVTLVLDAEKGKEGGTLWPEKWSSEALSRRKAEIGTMRYESEFRNNPLPEGMTLIRPSWIREGGEPPEYARYFIGVDTADSLKKHSDYTVIMVGATDEEGNLYVVTYERGHYSSQRYYDLLFEKVKRFEAVMVGIETPVVYKNRGTDALAKEMQERNEYFPVKTFTPVKDALQRSQRMIAKLERGKILIPRRHMALRDELVKFPFGEHDDTIDALVYLERTAFQSSAPTTKRVLPDMSPLGQLARAKRSNRLKDTIFNAW